MNKPDLVPFTKVELFAMTMILTEWREIGITAQIAPLPNSCTAKVVYQGQPIFVSAIKASYRGFIFSKGRYVAWIHDKVDGEPHDFIVAKNQTALWQDVLAVIVGGRGGLPSLESALAIAATS